MTTTRSVAVRPLDDKAITDIAELADRYALTAIKNFHPLKRAMMVAAGIRQLREAVQPLMPDLMPLKGSPLGFITDEKADKPPYPAEVVRDCVVEALLRRLNVSGNEFNIIAGRCYTALNGYQRLVEEFPGLTDLRTANTPPFIQGGQTVVKCTASWKLNGVENCLRDYNGKVGQLYAVTVHSSTGIDAKIGKARRRLYKAVYQLLSGTVFTEPDSGDETPELPAPEEKTRTQEVIEQVRNRSNGGQPTPSATCSADTGTLPAGSSLLSPAQKSEIGKLRHVMPDDEFQLLVEQQGVFDVDQLTADGANAILAILASSELNRRMA